MAPCLGFQLDPTACQVCYYIFQSIFSLYSVYIQCEGFALTLTCCSTLRRARKSSTTSCTRWRRWSGCTSRGGSGLCRWSGATGSGRWRNGNGTKHAPERRGKTLRKPSSSTSPHRSRTHPSTYRLYRLNIYIIFSVAKYVH